MNSTKDSHKSGLPVMEQFYTIQGEGFYSGRAAYFIRLEGCDVGCVWCDVKESWELKDEDHIPESELIKKVLETNCDFCVITGGEPAMHDLSKLVELLKNEKIEVAIETSGCYPLNGNVDWYCFSPKKFKAPVDQAYTLANELKIIISHPSDFAWAETHAAKVSPDCHLFLQPEWSKQERFLSQMIAYVKEHPKWKISLQTHKFMNIP